MLKLCVGKQFIPLSIYSQTSLLRPSLIRMPHNPNTLPGNLLPFSVFCFLFSNPHVSQYEHILTGNIAMYRERGGLGGGTLWAGCFKRTFSA